MPELRFPPRQSPAWRHAQVLCPQDGHARTIAPRAVPAHLAVTPDIAAAARKLQLQAYSDFLKGESAFDTNDVADASLLRFLDREEQLEPLVAWLRAEGLVGPDYDLDAMWLAAHEVGFHTDPCHAFSSASLVWQVAGPVRSVEFPQVGQAYLLGPGSTLMFDGAAPHGVRLLQFLTQPFEDVSAVCCPPAAADDIVVYLAVELPWTPQLETALGVGRVAEEDACEYHVDPCTGGMARSC